MTPYAELPAALLAELPAAGLDPVACHADILPAPGEAPPSRIRGGFMDRAGKGGGGFGPGGGYLKELGKPEWDPLWRLAALNGTGGPGGQR